MKVKLKKYLMLLTMVAGMLLSAAMPAFAYTGGTEQETGTADNGVGTVTGNISTETENTEDAPITEEPSDSERESEEEETPGRVNGESFSVPGNGQLVDDLSEDDSKQFLTIQTKNGNTFFMVLDRSNNTENVYMLSMIDENDLAEFIGDEQKEPEQEQPSVVIPETEKPSVSTETETGTETKPEAEEKKGGMSTGAMLAVVLLLAGGIGGYYYFKIWKPKQEEDEYDSEDLEFDDGACINEDQEDPDDDREDE